MRVNQETSSNMKSSVFVFLILISESTLCFQFDVERDEAVFQGTFS